MVDNNSHLEFSSFTPVPCIPSEEQYFVTMITPVHLNAQHQILTKLKTGYLSIVRKTIFELLLLIQDHKTISIHAVILLLKRPNAQTDLIKTCSPEAPTSYKDHSHSENILILKY